jgi:hypothetical protein
LEENDDQQLTNAEGHYITWDRKQGCRYNFGLIPFYGTVDAVILVLGGPFLYQFSTLHGCTWLVDPLNTNLYIMRMLIIL